MLTHAGRGCLLVALVASLVASACGGSDGGGLFEPAQLLGDWSGTWQSSGDDGSGGVTLVVTGDERDLFAVLDFNGPFLTVDPEPMVLSGPYDDRGVTLGRSDTPVGNALFRVTSNSVSGQLTNVPRELNIARVDWSGRLEPDRLDLAYAVKGLDGSLRRGTMTLTR